jgi:polyisoprenoid-binding protein YceI
MASITLPAVPRRAIAPPPVLLAALLAVAAPASAQDAPPINDVERPPAWKLDPVHTRVMFAVSHAGFSRALGTVSGSEGGLLYTPGDWRGARLVVDVPLARLDLGDAEWNRATLARNLLDAGNHPVARFVSTRVTPHDDTRAGVCGELTLRGATRPLCLDVTVNAVERHPMPPFRRTAGFSATATLARSDYGIDAWSSMIGDEVELRIEAEATRASAAFAERVFGGAATEQARDPAPEGAGP